MSKYQKTMLLEQRAPTIVGALSFMLLLLLTNNALCQEECAGLTYEGMCTGNLVQWCEEGEVIQVDCTDHGMVCAWDDDKGFSCVAGNTMNTCDLPPEGVCISDTTLHWCEEEGVETLECANGMYCGWNNEHQYYDCIPEDPYNDYTSEEPVEPTEESSTDDIPTTNDSDREDLDWEEESEEIAEEETSPDEEEWEQEESPASSAPEESPESGSERPVNLEREEKTQNSVLETNSTERLAEQQRRSPKEDMGLVRQDPIESSQPSSCHQGTGSNGFQLLFLLFGLLLLARKQRVSVEPR